MTQVRYILAALIPALVPAAAEAGDVALQLATREAYVNEPVLIQVLVINAKTHQPPQFPEIPGAVVQAQGRTGHNTSASYVNGRWTQKVTDTYSYKLIPRQAGKIRIPAIPVRVDGRVLKTAATTILVTTSETGDLLFVDLASDQESVYLGQAIEVDLEVWVRPYRDRNFRNGLPADDMLSRVDFDSSQWGSFHDTVLRLRNRELRWQYRQDTRLDSQGLERAYYVYVIPLKFVPTTTGRLDVGEVNVVVSYPTRTGRPDDFLPSFFDRYQVTQARPVRASLGESNITVRPTPAEGQPTYFNGAVGRYRFDVAANNTQVRVREPIEVTLTITGSGVLERVPPPPLAEIEELDSDFKVPEGTLSGVVEGQRKRFLVRIGAKRPDVIQIPPIPFCFFDPQAERYVTRWSDPIPLEVTASEQLPVSQFAETNDGGLGSTTRLTETAVGIRANYVDMDEVLAQQAFDPGWGTVAWLACSPAAYLLCV
ncbi:MAG: BatD family protein, partial [Planctomycetota bacterium]